jgi:hypothetical protein
LLILRRVGGNFELLKADVSFVNPVRGSRLKLSPQMPIAIEIR